MNLESLLESAKKDLKTLNELKNLAVKCGQYEFAAKCRELEKELFPITEEEQKETDRIKNIQTLLQMVGINVDEKKTLYKVDKALELYKKKKGKFDLKDAAKIIADSERIFFRD